MVDLEDVGFSLRGKGVDAGLDEEVHDTLRRDDCLAGLGEGLDTTDLLMQVRQDAGADTNEFGVCVAQIHRNVDAVFLPLPKKGLGPVDKEEVLVSELMLDISSGSMSARMSMREFVCERRPDSRRLYIVVDDVLLVAVE